MSRRSYRSDHIKLVTGLGFLAVFALMIAVTWVSMSTLHSVNAGMAALVDSSDAKTGGTFRLRDLIRLRSAASDALARAGDAEARGALFEQVSGHTRAYLESKGALAAIAVRPREREILSSIDASDLRIAEAYARVHDALYSPVAIEGRLATTISEVQLQEMVLLNHLNDLVELERTLSSEALEANRATYGHTQQVLIAIVGVAFSLCILITGFVVNRVSNANKRIAHLASHDDLTGLHNRRSFEEHLRHTLAIAERNDSTYGLLYIDLDRFKIVNDTCGHHAGDALLKKITQMISERLRRGDIFARVGGDEFAIIAQGPDFESLTRLAEDLRSIVAAFTFRYAEQDFKVSLSIGLVPVDGTVDDIQSIVTDVDSACYVAKRSGRNRVHVTTDNDAEVVRYRDDIAGVQSIRRALAEERLTLYFQPVFRIAEERVSMHHCEILLRVRSENGELYSPARIIPIAEKYDVMSEIDRWVFLRVVEWLAEHQHEVEVPQLLINLSGLSFIDEDFNDFIVTELERCDIDPTRIAFEITETAAVNNFERARGFIERVGALGCKLALDDFGTGFSSFACLKQLPVDYLKIDGKLVKNMIVDEVDREMVRAINGIGHIVGAETIAEFVEDDATLTLLREMKVDLAQGYGLRLPAPLEQLACELEPRTREPFRKAG